jgi:membrane protein
MMFAKRKVAPTPDELDLRTSAGDEAVWTADQLAEAEHTVDLDWPHSDEAPLLEGLDLRDSPGDEPVRWFGEHPAEAAVGAEARRATGEAPAPDAVDEDDDDHGRRAPSPERIPAAGWFDVAKRVKVEARRDNLTLVSAGIAFYALLSLAPALAAIVSVYGLVSDPADVTRQLDELSSTMPAEARQILQDQLTAVSSASGASLSFGVVIGIGVAFWGASAAMNQLLIALSLVYDEEETRGPVKLRGMAIGLTVGAIVFLTAVVALIALLPAWLANSPIGDAAATAVQLGRWPVLLVLMLAALAFLYQIGPDRDRPRFRWVSPGAIAATVLWLLASAAFSFYAAHFGSYNETYGAMGAIVVLMLWLLITSLCVLIGAEVNAELEHQTAVDSTVGPSRPMGERGAEVADTVAG